MTFGFQSAVDIATDAIDCIHTTAASHNRVFIVEVMGQKAGWLTLSTPESQVSADDRADPQIPYDIDKVVEAIDREPKQEKVLPFWQWQRVRSPKKTQLFPRSEHKEKLANRKHPSVS